MRLTKLFVFTTGVLLALVTTMIARSVVNDWQVLRSTEQGMQTMELAYLAMKVAEKASAERGPTIPVLNDTTPADPAKRERLVKAREASDQAFAIALDGLEQSKLPYSEGALMTLLRAQSQLVAARGTVDRVAALSFEERTVPGSTIRRVPIDQMFAVIDTAFDSVTQLTSASLRTYPELSQPVEGARLGAILREYAGRLGSQFTTPLATQKALTENERNEINRLKGRIAQLHQLIEMQAQTNADEPRVTRALSDMNGRYFSAGLTFIDSLTEAGVAGKPYGIDSTQFIARYVPEMTSIVTMRDAMFAVARDGVAQRVATAKRNLTINSLIGMALLLFEIAVFLLIRWRVLKPLLQSTQALVNIAAGKLDSTLARTTRRDEIGDLQNAVGSLRDTSLAKQTLEEERVALIGQLEAASNTDYLTKLLNRRGFARRAKATLDAAVENKRPVAMILFDIDHFKSVNDRYGHTIGDYVLQEVAQIARLVLHDGDCFARHGGEEFIVLLLDCTSTIAEQFALRLRNAVEAHPFIAGSQQFHITISLGISASDVQENRTLDWLIAQADQALYQAKSDGRNRVVRLVTNRPQK